MQLVLLMFTPDEKVKSASVGQPWSGSADEQNMFGTMDPTDRWAGWLYASDAESGKTAWRFKAPAPLLSGVTPTAGGVLFFGDMAGNEKDDRQDRGARHRIARRRPGATKSTAAGSPWHA